LRNSLLRAEDQISFLGAPGNQVQIPWIPLGSSVDRLSHPSLKKRERID